MRVHLDIPDESAAALALGSAEEFGRALRLAAAAKWYEAGRVGQGRAAELAGLSRAEFMTALGELGLSPFQESPDQVVVGL